MRLSPVVRRTALAAGAGLGTAGLLAGVILLGPLVASLLLVVVFALIWPLAALVRRVAEDAPEMSPLLIAAGAAGGMLCVPGVVRLFTWGAGGIVVALGAAVLFAVGDLVAQRFHRSGRARSEHARSGRAGPGRVRAEPGDLVQLSVSDHVEDEALIQSLECPLSIEELCEVWSETACALGADADARDRQSAAEVRRICLDEFERRNPDGFHRWIGAGAPGDPGSFLLSKGGDH